LEEHYQVHLGINGNITELLEGAPTPEFLFFAVIGVILDRGLNFDARFQQKYLKIFFSNYLEHDHYVGLDQQSYFEMLVKPIRNTLTRNRF
jgi:hypothetical protein